MVQGPKSVGKIDLEPKKFVEKPVEKVAEEQGEAVEKVQAVAEVQPETPSIEKPVVEAKVVAEGTPTIEVKSVPKISSKKTEEVVPVEAKNSETVASESDPIDDTLKTKYLKLSGTTSTGQKIDLSQFDKPKKKKEEPKIQPNKPGTPGAANANNDPNKNKRKRIAPKPGFNAANPNAANRTPGGPNKGPIKPGTGGCFKSGNRPAIVAKVEPTEEEVQKQIRETLEKLQGKGNKSKAAKYRRDKRETHRQRSDDELKAIEEGSKTIKVTEFVTVGEIATMMDVPITKVIGTCM